jgi:ABC-type phosphate/phosphonate transport system substrate-binding protein
MYDYPEVQAATTALAAAISLSLGDCGTRAQAAPLGLVQTCGYPLTHALRGRVRVVATPRYRAEGCERACYSSAIVARASGPSTLLDYRGSTVALNAPDSQSGYHALRHALRDAAPFPFFARACWTGAHRTSVQAVRCGDADLAAIDAVSYALLAKHAAHEIEGLRVLAWTAAAPALPYVTAAAATDDDVVRMRAALDELFSDRALEKVTSVLLLEGIEVLAADAYEIICAMEQAADDAGVVLVP